MQTNSQNLAPFSKNERSLNGDSKSLGSESYRESSDHEESFDDKRMDNPIVVK